MWESSPTSTDGDAGEKKPLFTAMGSQLGLGSPDHIARLQTPFLGH